MTPKLIDIGHLTLEIATIFEFNLNNLNQLSIKSKILDIILFPFIQGDI
jgi:hypothetical protein